MMGIIVVAFAICWAPFCVMFTRYGTDGFLKSVRSVDCTTLYTLYTYTSEHNQLSERFSAFLPAVVLDEKKVIRNRIIWNLQLWKIHWSMLCILTDFIEKNENMHEVIRLINLTTSWEYCSSYRNWLLYMSSSKNMTK